MVFSSLKFLLIFLPAFLLIYYLIPAKVRIPVLLIGSLVFYAFGEPIYILLLIDSVLINYLIGRWIGHLKERGHRRLAGLPLTIGIILNVSMLGLFKWAPASLHLPLGISFYTFQILAYLLDVYAGTISAERNFLYMATYVCMFPQLVAGPIVNYDEVRMTMQNPRVSAERLNKGLLTFTAGLVLKVLLADRLSLLWNDISAVGYESIATPVAWMGALSYSMQIYFDFYGYSLMAIGLGRALGFNLPVNFDLPYAADSFREFYRRWHITLGRWFRKYIYIPMGGSRHGLFRTIVNLTVVWVLTSLWHGIGWNYLIWGMGLCLVIIIEQIVAQCVALKGTTQKTPAKIFGHMYVILLIPVTWVCFAITDIRQLGIYLGRMFGLYAGVYVNNAFLWRELSKYGPLLAVGIFLCTPAARKLYKKAGHTVFGMLVSAALFWLCVWYISVMGDNPFLYFRF